jgi:hypothetical protein
MILTVIGLYLITTNFLGLHESTEYSSMLGSITWHYTCKDNSCTYDPMNYTTSHPEEYPTLEHYSFAFYGIAVMVLMCYIGILFGAITLLFTLLLYHIWSPIKIK